MRLLHISKVSVHRSSARGYRKRRCDSSSYTRLREVPSEVTSGRGGRVERRTAGLMGRRSFLSIRTRPPVPRNPPPEVYRDFGDALQTLIVSDTIRTGKGLMPVINCVLHLSPHTLHCPPRRI